MLQTQMVMAFRIILTMTMMVTAFQTVKKVKKNVVSSFALFA